MSDKGLDNKNIPSDGGVDNEKPQKSGEKLDDKEKDPRSKGWFKKGYDPRRNTDGRPKGTRDWRTDFELAIESVADRLGKTKSEVRVTLLSKGLQKAMKGNARFWTYIADREYGKETQPIDADVNIPGAKELAESIQTLLENDNIQDQPKTKKGSKKDS